METIIKDATLSDCETYRYTLSRIWDLSKPQVMFIMLNPSTADALKDDPTIKRCIAFAKSWGYGGINVGNLFAYRSRFPIELFHTLDPVGKENIKFLKDMALKSEIIVCAWGNGSLVEKLKKKLWPEYFPLKGLYKPLHYLELCNDGTPKHPLYLKSNLKPQTF